MKRWIVKAVAAIVLTLVSTVAVYAQAGFVIRTSHAVSVTYTGADVHTIYVLFPDANGNWYLSETLPTATYGGNNPRPMTWWVSGDVYLMIQVDLVGGTETDSLMHEIKPLVWDPADKEFATIETDYTYLVFGQRNNYTSSTPNYLDWDSGEEYGCLLTGKLWPVAGFAITGRSYFTTSSAKVTYWITVSQELR